MNTPKSGTKSAKNTPKPTSTTQVTTDFGIRKISNQNFSKVIALPKIALENLGNYTNLKVELVQEKDEKFLKLSPVRGKRN